MRDIFAVLLDTMFKLNFGVVFGMRELIEELPKLSKMTQPLGRICDLLEAAPTIEPQMIDAVLVNKQAASDEGEEQAAVSSDKPGKLKPERFHGLIEFRNVHFAYPSDLRKKVLDGFSCTVRPGEKVALVGPTGCGKSSCMALLQRLYTPQAGDIFLDGHPLEDYDLHWLRSRVVIVDQNTVLFSDTIKANVAYGLPPGSFTEADIVQALKDAKAWEFVEEMPDGLMSMVASGGGNLSGGQKQRLAIARAMVRRPDVILLDEATSALDTEDEAMVQQALDVLARQGSALVIAHRLTTVKDSDRIVVVDKGAVVEEGTHEELIAKDSQTAQVKAHEECNEKCANSRASYQRLWEAATGMGENLSVKQHEQELVRLQKMMRKHTQALKKMREKQDSI